MGWFHGPAEFGPRALGGRSILASPLDPSIRENLKYSDKDARILSSIRSRNT